jgi:hypothetical protein
MIHARNTSKRLIRAVVRHSEFSACDLFDGKASCSGVDVYSGSLCHFATSRAPISMHVARDYIIGPTSNRNVSLQQIWRTRMKAHRSLYFHPMLSARKPPLRCDERRVPVLASSLRAGTVWWHATPCPTMSLKLL